MPKGVYIRTQYYKDLVRQRQATKEFKIKHSQDCKGKCGVYKRTEEQKTILRENGKKYGFQKGYKPVHLFQKGYKWTKSHRENHGKYKMTEHHKSLCGQYKRTEYHINLLKEFNNGEKNWNWKGGISLNKRLYQQSMPRYIKNAYSRKHRHRIGISGRGVRLGGKLTVQTIQRVYEDNIKCFGTLTCYLCLEPIIFGKDVLEHIIPLSRKGTNKYENLAIACNVCNNIKHNRLIEEIS